MRLTPKEISNLIQAIEEFGQNQMELRLFGSRTNDQLKGGDIDLLLLVQKKILKDQLNTQKHLILARMKELIGDQKIDLKIAQIDEINNDPFLQIIFPKSIPLKIW